MQSLLRIIRNQKSISHSIQKNFCIVSHHIESQDNDDHVPFEFTQESYKQLDWILSKYPSNYKKSAVIPALFVAQKQNNNFLSLSAMKKVAKVLDIPEMDVYEVASFYTMFNRQKVGKYHLQVCGTTPCQLCGSETIIQAIKDFAHIEMNGTSKDGMFTLSEVECLGACANAPMIQVNNEHVYEDLTYDSMQNIMKMWQQGNQVKVGPQNGRNRAEGIMGRTSLKEFDFNKEHRIERDFAMEKELWLKAKEEAEKKKAQAATTNK